MQEGGNCANAFNGIDGRHCPAASIGNGENVFVQQLFQARDVACMDHFEVAVKIPGVRSFFFGRGWFVQLFFCAVQQLSRIVGAYTEHVRNFLVVVIERFFERMNTPRCLGFSFSSSTISE